MRQVGQLPRNTNICYSDLFKQVNNWYKCCYVVLLLCLGTLNVSSILYGSFDVKIRFKTVLLYIERRLKVFENRVLRIIFGSKRDEVIGEWRRLHNEEFEDHEILFG